MFSGLKRVRNRVAVPARSNVEAATAEPHEVMEIPVCNFGEFAQRNQRSEIFSTIREAEKPPSNRR